MLTRVWEIRSVDGFGRPEFAHATLPADVDAVLVHSPPTRIDVEVLDNGSSLRAQGTNLRADADTPIARLTMDGLVVLREQIWPGEDDVGVPMILPGGEAATLLSWWTAADRRSWRWRVEFVGGRDHAEARAMPRGSSV